PWKTESIPHLFARIAVPEQEESPAPDRTGCNVMRLKHYSLRTQPATRDCGLYVSARLNCPVFWLPKPKNRTIRSRTYRLCGLFDVAPLQRTPFPPKTKRHKTFFTAKPMQSSPRQILLRTVHELGFHLCAK